MTDLPVPPDPITRDYSLTITHDGGRTHAVIDLVTEDQRIGRIIDMLETRPTTYKGQRVPTSRDYTISFTRHNDRTRVLIDLETGDRRLGLLISMLHNKARIITRS